VALVGLGFQVVLLAVFILLAVWSNSQSVWALTRLSGIGVTIWLFLVLIYQQRVLVQDEALETEQLRKDRERSGGEAIFDVESEQFLLARRRLQWMYKWLLPFFTIVILAELFIAAFYRWPWSWGDSLQSEQWGTVQNANLLIWFVGGAAFLCFLFSRYATGMARYPEWKMLRAGASFLMGITLGAVATAVTLGILHYAQTPIPERVAAFVLRFLFLLLFAEYLLNFVLDFYRPRSPEDIPQPAFDSRILGLFCEAGGIAKSIADTINYQFGFEVSSTWFYQLLQRSVVPLIGFGILILFASSCLVFVEADEQAILERFGRKREKVLEPGLHIKYPWPIDIAYKVATQRIHEHKVGESDQIPDGAAPHEKLILWTNQHSDEPHLKVLVATPELAEFITPRKAVKDEKKRETLTIQTDLRTARAFGEEGEAVPVSLLRVAATLQYQILDAYQWIKTYSDPQAMLESIADREITRYCATVEIEDLMGLERGNIEQDLWKRIQEKIDAEQLGVKIVFFGLQGVHPPVDTAKDFQEVIGAEQKKTATIRSAWVDYNKRLTEVAGDVHQAEQLAETIRRMDKLEFPQGQSTDSNQEFQEAQKQVHDLFFGNESEGIEPVSGEAARLIAEARAKRWNLENDEHGRAQKFLQEMAMKNAAPKVYRVRKYLQMLTESLSNIRKYVIATDGQVKPTTFQLNIQDPMGASLDAILEEEE